MNALRRLRRQYPRGQPRVHDRARRTVHRGRGQSPGQDRRPACWSSVQFVTVDVFTDRQFGGNPLAVVLNGDDLTSSQMQAIASEFNLAETTFVLPPKDVCNTAHIRIFTPRAEMPFAGHPNVGTAFALAREGNVYDCVISGPSLLFEEIAGLVTIYGAREPLRLVPVCRNLL
jgi:predicted PhzF superfamily epimerase YddE/YHI9